MSPQSQVQHRLNLTSMSYTGHTSKGNTETIHETLLLLVQQDCIWYFKIKLKSLRSSTSNQLDNDVYRRFWALFGVAATK